MTRNTAAGWNVLALALLLGISAPQVRAEESATTRESGKTYTNEQGKQVTVVKSGTVTKNADGSTTREGGRTTANTETGRSRTIESSSQVTPTENGKTWTHDRKVENSAGGSHSSHTEGQVTRNGDGTGSATSHTDRRGTTARGKTWSSSTDRQVSYKRSKGSVKKQRSATHTGSRRMGARRR
jgi:hypothetical protein